MDGCVACLKDQISNFQNRRTDFIQLMLNAREMTMKTEQMGINLDADEEKFEHKQTAKGMSMEVSVKTY